MPTSAAGVRPPPAAMPPAAAPMSPPPATAPPARAPVPPARAAVSPAAPRVSARAAAVSAAAAAVPASAAMVLVGTSFPKVRRPHPPRPFIAARSAQREAPGSSPRAHAPPLLAPQRRVRAHVPSVKRCDARERRARALVNQRARKLPARRALRQNPDVPSSRPP